MARLRRKTSSKIFQQGGAYSGNVYRGTIPKRFRGGGIGNIITGALKGVMKTIPKQILKTGVGLFHDITHGQNIKKSFQTRGKNLARNIGLGALNQGINAITNNVRRRRRTTTTTRKRQQPRARGRPRKTGRPRKKTQRGGGLSTRKANTYIVKNKKQTIFGDMV